MVSASRMFCQKTKMEEYNVCDDMDDDWFFESVLRGINFRLTHDRITAVENDSSFSSSRYNTLQMFYLQNIPDHLLQLDDSTLCVASRNSKCENVELLKLKLPAKLTVPPEEEGRVKENDFKMLSGMYIDKPIYQMGAIRQDKKIITSQTRKMGLQVYSFELDDESSRKEELLVASKLCTPNFAVLQEERKLVCSQCNHKPLILYDIYSEGIVKELKHPLLLDYGKETEDICDCCNLKCQLLDPNTLSVLDSDTGEVALIDLRTGNTVSKLGKHENPCDSFVSWTLSDFDYKIFASYFGILSTKGALHLYDIRNFSNCLINECFNSTVNNFNSFKLKMGNRDQFSISGLDSNVYVYSISQNSTHSVFTHNGHCQLVSDKSEYLINDHIWLPSVGDRFIVSVCENRTLNCWEYNK